jgi:ribosomal protein L29
MTTNQSEEFHRLKEYAITRTLREKRRELARMLTVLSEQLSKENA